MERQKTYMGDCYFPPGPHGLVQVYDLPMPENKFQDKIHRAFHIEETDENFWSLYSEVWNRNQIISPTEDRRSAFNFLYGVVSRIPEKDIRFFLKIGGGANRSKTEQKAIKKAEKIAKMVYGGTTMDWVLSPQTVIEHALRFEDECPLLVSETIQIAKSAKSKRENGNWEPEYPNNIPEIEIE